MLNLQSSIATLPRHLPQPVPRCLPSLHFYLFLPINPRWIYSTSQRSELTLLMIRIRKCDQTFDWYFTHWGYLSFSRTRLGSCLSAVAPSWGLQTQPWKGRAPPLFSLSPVIFRAAQIFLALCCHVNWLSRRPRRRVFPCRADISFTFSFFLCQNPKDCVDRRERKRHNVTPLLCMWKKTKRLKQQSVTHIETL